MREITEEKNGRGDSKVGFIICISHIIRVTESRRMSLV
jgi:hypothetical protein